jgi:hypothetical protein
MREMMPGFVAGNGTDCQIAAAELAKWRASSRQSVRDSAARRSEDQLGPGFTGFFTRKGDAQMPAAKKSKQFARRR